MTRKERRHPKREEPAEVPEHLFEELHTKTEPKREEPNEDARDFLTRLLKKQ